MTIKIGKVVLNIFNDSCSKKHRIVKVNIWNRNPGVRSITLLGANHMILRDDLQLPFSVTGVDARGFAVTTFDNPPKWASSNPSVGVITADDPSGMTATFVPAALGDTQIQVSIDNGDGSTVHGTFDLTVVPSEAVSVTVVAGTPAHIPPSNAKPAPPVAQAASDQETTPIVDGPGGGSETTPIVDGPGGNG